MEEMILILDFGSQYTQLIARRIRELNVYCEIHPYNNIPKLSQTVKGVILSGSPFSVRDEDAPKPDLSKIRKQFPLLGVCYGAQLMAQTQGGSVEPSEHREYGRANLSFVENSNVLVKDMSLGSQVWMSHGDTILNLPEDFEVIASTNDVRVGGYQIKGEQTFGIQFHPEVYHSVEGAKLLKNFIVDICGLSQSWTPDSFVDTTIAELKEELGNDRVVLGLSGGVDSSVAALLLHKAIGKNLHCIFVDNGLLRKNEFEEVLESYKHMGLNIKGVNSSARFYKALAGIIDPEAKRKAIGNAFIEVFDEEAHKIKDVKWLAQGTIYPDIIESISVKGPSADVTPEKVAILQDVDHIFIQGLKDNGLYDMVWQAGAMLTPIQSVGVMGDDEFLAKVSNDIINKVKGVNRVVYDISSKPPATIEWE
ncbi:MAG: GMP synthase (glutamine-hydrolyzing) [Bacteroidetes bacterium 4572_77]|nr:MAG: GMP synthase (glutamine-hydrolyzing) [Bacteroidetes bacterium 4572_77]